MATKSKNPMKSYIKGVGQETPDNYGYNYPYYSGGNDRAGQINFANKNGIGSIDTGKGFDAAYNMNDPMFNLGSALGTLWGMNYNQRGADKATAEAQAILDKYQGVQQQQQPASDALYQTMKNATAPDMAQQATEAVMGKQAPYEPKAEDLEKGLKYFDEKGNFKADAPQTFMPQQRDLAAEKLDYRFNKWQQAAAAGTDNPTTDGNQVKSDVKLASQALNQGIPDNWDIDKVRAELVSELRKNGRNDWQIEQATRAIEPKLQLADKQFKQQKGDRLYETFSNALAGGDVYKAYQAFNELADLDPNRAKRYSLQMEDARTNQLRDRQIAQNMEIAAKAFPELSEAERYRYAVAGLSGMGAFGKSLGTAGKGGGGKAAKTDILADNGQGITWSKTDESELQNYMKLEADGKLTSQADKDYLAMLRQKKYIARGMIKMPNGQGGGTAAPQVDGSDYNALHEIIDNKIASLGDKVGSDDLRAAASALRKQFKTREAEEIAQEYENQAARWDAQNQAEKDAANRARWREDYAGPTFLGYKLSNAGKDAYENIKDDYENVID